MGRACSDERECRAATTAERKGHLISMRLPEADIAMIDRAAGLRGRSRMDFVRDAAVRAAEDVLMENRLIRMSPEGFAEFMAALSGPGKPVPEMVEVAKRPAPWESGYTAMISAPEPLTVAHDVSEFTRGKPTLDHWLRTRALSNQEKDFTAILVVHEAGRVVGYYGLAPTAIVPNVLPRSIRTGRSPDSVPCLLLGQLATDINCVGRGIGMGLVKYALERCVHAANLAGWRPFLAVTAASFHPESGPWPRPNQERNGDFLAPTPERPAIDLCASNLFEVTRGT